ncbi:MAG: NAD(P)-dependent oxidoreductase [Gammaproteobacteria bacterium]|nr:NAD(P)-dependent oxidoreductase [Gammaproteobacteria bacterium]
MSTTIDHIGVAGCGAMGLPMAERLLGAGFRVSGFDVRPLSEFGEFAEHMDASVNVLRQCDCVISVVRDAAETDALCFSDQALFAARPYPRLLVVSSTLSPRTIGALRERLPDDVELVDAPMSGAPHRAREGTLTFMAGGDTDTIARLQSALEAMGNTVFHLGPLGAGMTIKVLNNYVAASSVAATRRSMQLAQKAGVDPALLHQVMRASSGANWYVDNFDSIDWGREGYAPNNTIGILEKDVQCALDIETDELQPADEALLQALRRLHAI